LKLSRQEEVDYLSKTECTLEKANIRLKDFGTSVGGKETLTSNQPLPSDAYPSQLQKRRRRKSYATI
jgi:argininosuccinate synthase